VRPRSSGGIDDDLPGKWRIESRGKVGSSTALPCQTFVSGYRTSNPALNGLFGFFPRGVKRVVVVSQPFPVLGDRHPTNMRDIHARLKVQRSLYLKTYSLAV